jgi:hypothetical protein
MQITILLTTSLLRASKSVACIKDVHLLAFVLHYEEPEIALVTAS